MDTLWPANLFLGIKTMTEIRLNNNNYIISVPLLSGNAAYLKNIASFDTAHPKQKYNVPIEKTDKIFLNEKYDTFFIILLRTSL